MSNEPKCCQNQLGIKKSLQAINKFFCTLNSLKDKPRNKIGQYSTALNLLLDIQQKSYFRMAIMQAVCVLQT